MPLVRAFRNLFDVVETGSARARTAIGDFSAAAAQSQRDAEEFRKAVNELRDMESVQIPIRVTGDPSGVGDVPLSGGGGGQMVQTGALRDSIDALRRMSTR